MRHLERALLPTRSDLRRNLFRGPPKSLDCRRHRVYRATSPENFFVHIAVSYSISIAILDALITSW